LLPFQGAGYYTAAGEAKREAVNTWIRTSGAFDGVIDFDAVMRDPADPLRLDPAYDSGDHLHPNDAGYQAMADAINLQMLLPLSRSARALAAWITGDVPPPGMTALSPGRFGALPDDAPLRRGLWQYAHYYDPATA